MLPSDVLALPKVWHQYFRRLHVWHILRLVKLLNLPHDNVWFGWLLFIEYASTTLLFPHTWLGTRTWTGCECQYWPSADGLARYRSSVLMTLTRCHQWMPHPRMTRIIEDAANSHSFNVPGGDRRQRPFRPGFGLCFTCRLQACCFSWTRRWLWVSRCSCHPRRQVPGHPFVL